MDQRSAFSNVRIKNVSLIRRLLNRFEAAELSKLFSLDARGQTKSAIIKHLLDEHLSNGISLAEISELDICYEWSQIETEEEGKLKPSKRDWEAYELIFPVITTQIIRHEESDTARSNPRQLQSFLHLELDSYFQNYCSVKTHKSSGAVWIRIQLAESDTQTRAALVSKSASAPQLDTKTNSTIVPEWWPSPSNTIFFLYFLNSNFFLAGPIKKEFKKYLLNALSSALGATGHKECQLKGKDILGLKELLLQRDSQGQYRQLRTKRDIYDVNPLDRSSQLLRKKAKLKETDLQITDPALQTSNLDPKNRLVEEETGMLTKLTQQVEQVFGVAMQYQTSSASSRTSNPLMRRQEPANHLPVLSTLSVRFLNEPYQGITPTKEDMGDCGEDIDLSELSEELKSVSLSCNISIGGPSIIEGFKQILTTNVLVVGTEEFSHPQHRSLLLAEGKALPSLAPFLENLQSMARNNFVFDRNGAVSFDDNEDDAD